MKCKYDMEDIINYHEGLLSVETANDVKQHIDSCEDCKKSLSLLSFTGDYISESPSFDRSINDRVLASIDKTRYKKRKITFTISKALFKLKSLLRPALITVAACLLVLVSLTYFPQLVGLSDKFLNLTGASSKSEGSHIDKQGSILNNDISDSLNKEDETNNEHGKDNPVILDDSIENFRNSSHFPSNEYIFEEVNQDIKIDKASAASEALKSEKDAKNHAGKITALLTSLTKKKHPLIPGSNIFLNQYPVWIISFYDVEITAQGGYNSEPRTFPANTHVFIDANTGEILQTNSYSIFSMGQAIAKAKEHHPKTEFPDKPGKASGNIYAGGKPPGLVIPAELETKAFEKGQDIYIIRLTQYWKADDLRGPNSQGPILSYFWEYRVTRDSIDLLDQGGDPTLLLIK